MATMIPIGRSQPKMKSRRSVDSMRPENSTLCAASSAMSGVSSTPGSRTV